MKKLLFVMCLFMLPLVSAVCYDYDNGNNPYQAGFVAYGEGSYLYDYCDKATGILLEYSCNGEIPVINNYQCMSGCGSVYYRSVSVLYGYAYTWQVNHELGYCRSTSGYLDYVAPTRSVAVVTPPIPPKHKCK
jgi:hypothetical protein